MSLLEKEVTMEQVGAQAFHCAAPWGPRTLQDARVGSVDPDL